MVMTMFTEKITQSTTTRVATGHSSSAYSLERFIPMASVTAASAITTLKSHNWAFASPGLQRLLRVRRCVM